MRGRIVRRYLKDDYEPKERGDARSAGLMRGTLRAVAGSCQRKYLLLFRAHILWCKEWIRRRNVY